MESPTPVALPPALKSRSIPKYLLARAQVKAYALKVSKAHRAGKFTRVGDAFFIACEARVESEIRRLCDADKARQAPPHDKSFVKQGVAVAKILERLEDFARVVIFNKVMAHPTRGKTLLD